MDVTISVPDALVDRLNATCQGRGFGPTDPPTPRGQPFVKWLDAMIAAEVRAAKIQAAEEALTTEEAKATPDDTEVVRLTRALRAARAS